MKSQDVIVEAVPASGKKRTPIGRILLAVLVVAVCVAQVWVIVNFNDIRSFQAMPSGAYAKFVCSSLFVVGMDEESAKEWASIPVPVQEAQIDYEGKRVTTRALFYTSVARYEGERLGCTLE